MRAFGRKKLKPMRAVDINQEQGMSARWCVAMLSSSSNQFEISTSSCALALANEKDNQGWSHSATSLACSSQRKKKQNHRRQRIALRRCTLRCRRVISVLCGIKQSEPNNRIKIIRFAHSTVQQLRASPALYAWRYAAGKTGLDILYMV